MLSIASLSNTSNTQPDNIAEDDTQMHAMINSDTAGNVVLHVDAHAARSDKEPPQATVSKSPASKSESNSQRNVRTTASAHTASNATGKHHMQHSILRPDALTEATTRSAESMPPSFGLLERLKKNGDFPESPTTEFVMDTHEAGDRDRAMRRMEPMEPGSHIAALKDDIDAVTSHSHRTTHRLASRLESCDMSNDHDRLIPTSVTIVDLDISDVEGQHKPVEFSLRTHDLDELDRTVQHTLAYGQEQQATPSQNPPPPDSNSSSNSAYQFQAFKQKLMQHKTLKIIQISLVVFINLMTLFGGLYKNGVVIDTDSAERTARGLILVNGVERPIVASNLFQLLCIIVARSSAFFMYPALVMVYISKLRAITSFLARTTVSMFLDCDLHELHLYCGYTILIFSISHTLAHLIRWADQGNLNLVFDHFTGLTGFLIITSCILICTPMFMYRQKIKYEIRKNLHYLFLLFGVALCFHTKPAAVPNGGFTQYVFGTVMILYVLDNAYCYFIMTEKIETTKFDVLPTGVQMTMRVSEEFQKKGANGGYCYVCLPWIDKKQWHAFSLFENPGDPTERQIFMQKGGDWTSKVHRVLQRDTVRPVWVQGPFPSPYNSAEKYDNQILVASGIGITPALSVIRAQKDSRRINLVWAVRDKHLLEFFLRHLYLDHKGWNLIFYTGKTPLDDEHMEIFSNTNICIIKGRPKLGDVIPNIIYGIESGEGLPERYVPDEKMGASELLVDMLGGGGASCSRSDSGDGDAGGGGSDTETGVDNNVEDDFDDTASVTTQQINEVIETAKHYGFELDGINKEGLKTQPDVRCPKANRNRRSTAIAENLRLAFKPWEFNAEARPYVKSLSKKLVMKTWGLMYCGGAKVVEKDLRKIGSELKVDLHIESFGW